MPSPPNFLVSFFPFSLSTTRLSSFSMAQTAPPPPMMPAETFSGEPKPRLRLIQQSSSHAPRYQKHPLSCPCERQTFLCAKRERNPGQITAAAIVPLHPILGRTPKPVCYSSIDGNHNKRTALLMRRGRQLAWGETVARKIRCFGIITKSGVSLKISP